MPIFVGRFSLLNELYYYSGVVRIICKFSVVVMYVCNSRKVKMKSRVKIVITIEFLVEFYTR